jgi:UDP-N-acetyl-D-mannosaminuronic acid dehydrogenase
LQPGPGVGGHCIAVDPWFIVSKTPKESPLIRTAREVNNYKTEWVIEKIKNAALIFECDHGRKPVIACLGLAFKPDIDDLRESPALHIVQKLSRKGLNIIGIEPNISITTSYHSLGINSDLFKLSSLQESQKQIDIFVLLVAHKEFKRTKNNNKYFLDFCGVIN